MPGTTRRVTPKSPVDGRISGSICAGMSKNDNRSLSQYSVATFISRVRLALVTSVTWIPPSVPAVRFQMIQVSIVPNSTSPRSARARRPGTESSSHRSRGAAK